MRNMGKKIGELHTLLIECEKGLPIKGLRGERNLKQGAIYLYVGNGVRAQAEAIGSFNLVLPNGLAICSDNFSKNNILYFNAIPYDGIHEIDMLNLVPNVTFIYNVSNKRAKHNLDSTYLWHWRLAHIRYPKETMSYYFYFPPENKIVVARYVEFFENNLISQEASGRETYQAPEHLCLNVEVEEHSLEDHNEPTNYKDVLSYPEPAKWLDTMIAEMKSMKDNQVWCLVDLPPNAKTVGSKWLFKKNTDMNGIVHTYKAHLVEKGYT
nr:hypothetical protein [Tanacetum cinerariifolium]